MNGQNYPPPFKGMNLLDLLGWAWACISCLWRRP